MRAATLGIVCAALLGIAEAHAQRWERRDDMAAVFMPNHALAFGCDRGFPVVLFSLAGKYAGQFTKGVSYPLEFVGSDGGVMELGGVAVDRNILSIRFRGTMPAMFLAPVTVRVRVRDRMIDFPTPHNGAARAISDALAGCVRY